MKRQEKTFFVQNLTEEIKSASSVVLVNYSGLSVKAQQDLKKRLAEVGAKMSVVKNTLFKLAGKSAKVPNEALADTVLAGPSAMVITEADPLAPLSVLAKFAEENGIPQFKVGLIEGSFQDKFELEELAKLPGKDAIIAQTVATIAQPMYGLVSTLQGNLQKLVLVLNQASKA